MKVKLWQTWAILAAAGWLYFSPFFLGFAQLSQPAAALAWVCAVVLTISASEALVIPDPIEEWVDTIVGVALMVGPWVFQFSSQTTAAINSVVVGALVTVFAISALMRELKEHVPGHHWPAKV